MVFAQNYPDVIRRLIWLPVCPTVYIVGHSITIAYPLTCRVCALSTPCTRHASTGFISGRGHNPSFSPSKHRFPSWSCHPQCLVELLPSPDTLLRRVPTHPAKSPLHQHWGVVGLSQDIDPEVLHTTTPPGLCHFCTTERIAVHACPQQDRTQYTYQSHPNLNTARTCRISARILSTPLLNSEIHIMQMKMRI
jgi:hypothetical protein